MFSLNRTKVRVAERKVVNALEKGLMSYYGKQAGHVFSSGHFGQRTVAHPLFNWADIINLHWVNAGTLDLRQIARLKKPVVWTMRDMWPFTGGCHYSLDCSKFETGCGNCPILQRSSQSDVTNWASNYKQQLFKKANFHFVGISEWVTQSFRESFAGKKVNARRVHTIDNCIEDHNFFPEEVHAGLRNELKIPPTGKIVLSGAANNNTLYKGGKYLNEILDKLQQLPNTTVVVFGSSKVEKVEGCHYAGYINDDAVLRKYYSVADVFVAASVQEAFGKTIAESMACGTPVVAFDSSGPAAMIEHGFDGFLAGLYDISQFVSLVRKVLELSPADYNTLTAHSLIKAQSSFAKTKAAKDYTALYRTIASGTTAG